MQVKKSPSCDYNVANQIFRSDKSQRLCRSSLIYKYFISRRSVFVSTLKRIRCRFVLQM